MNKWTRVLPVVAVLLLIAPDAFAQEAANSYKGLVAVGAGMAMGFAVLGGAFGQGIAARGALEGIARNPQASGRITVPMFAGLAFIESLIILTFIVAFSLAGKV